LPDAKPTAQPQGRARAAAPAAAGIELTRLKAIKPIESIAAMNEFQMPGT
jgi:hypothetical protein